MKRALFILLRAARIGLLALGLAALLAVLMQFTSYPWRLYKRLAECPGAVTNTPTHILVLGGSGIPGKSGLMRTFYGARAAELFPEAELLVAMPLPADESDASRAYLEELRLRGVPPERMAILPDGRNTREQALKMAEFLGDAIHTATVLIVSDDTHIRRTAGCLRKVGITRLRALPAFQYSLEDPIPWMALLPTPSTESDAAEPAAALSLEPAPECSPLLALRYTFWTNLGYTYDSLHEYAGLIVYRLRDWI